MTVIAFAGDWHGNIPWARKKILEVAENGVRTLHHAGDFGIWPGPSGKRFLSLVESQCAHHGVQLTVTPGNHEDWARLDQIWANNPKRRDAAGNLLPIPLTDHLTVLPRGWRWEEEGRSFVSLGGAPSVDFEDRVEGGDWWPSEAITQADVERCIAGGNADVMITHDAPDTPYQVPAVASICAYNPLGFSQTALAYAAAGRELMNAAYLGVAPKLLVHGHYHVADESAWTLPGRTYESRIWSLAADRQAGNIRYLDLETLTDPSWAPS